MSPRGQNSSPWTFLTGIKPDPKAEPISHTMTVKKVSAEVLPYV